MQIEITDLNDGGKNLFIRRGLEENDYNSINQIVFKTDREFHEFLRLISFFIEENRNESYVEVTKEDYSTMKDAMQYVLDMDRNILEAKRQEIQRHNNSIIDIMKDINTLEETLNKYHKYGDK